jgi:hypothetical protein
MTLIEPAVAVPGATANYLQHELPPEVGQGALEVGYGRRPALRQSAPRGARAVRQPGLCF